MGGKTTAEQIREVIAEIGALEAVRRHYDSTVEELQETLAKKDRIEDEMIQELEDVNNLEKLGIKSIFYNVLGSKEQQLEKERQEYLQVTLQHKEVVKALEVIQFEKDILEKKLHVVDDWKQKLEQLKKVREQEIKNMPGPLRDQLNSIHTKMDECEVVETELNEALGMGQRTYQSLEAVYTHLKSGDDWGQWRRGSGRQRTTVKFNAIDRAVDEMSRSKLLLRNFNKELTDVGYSNLRLALQLENIDKFPKVMFDNLISDWILKTKIVNALATIGSLMDDVKMILEILHKDKANNAAKRISLEKNKDQLLEEN